MRIFRSPWGNVTLADERKRHISAFHPDIAPYLPYFWATLYSPERVIHSKHDANVIICYRRLPKRKLFLAIVLRLKPNANFILTAYLTHNIRRL